MAPKGVSNWRRPYTSIYNDNYRYGTGLYSDTLTDIEKRYSDSLSKTQLRSDRPDLAFTTFSGSNLASSPNPAGESNRELARQSSMTSSPIKDLVRSPTFESKLNSAMASSYALDDEVQDVINRREQRKQQAISRVFDESTKSKSRSAEESSRPKSLYDDASFWTLQKTTEPEIDSSKPKRKFGTGHTSTNGPSSSHWREKSRELQDQVDTLDKSMSDVSSKLRNELSTLKSRYHTEINDLSSSVENTGQQASELQKVCKRQANQLLELQSAYDDAQRNINDALEEMSIWQSKCKSLKKEMDRLKEEVEQAVHKKSKNYD
ncbi:myosin-1-like [Uloborus diversus]|uniref:myosin-1-like n=1 Tax=Uloborus diversus TaxID=327109 RepID=UPI002409FCC7|nr:myosin-1-like [Uloborus diversus]